MNEAYERTRREIDDVLYADLVRITRDAFVPRMAANWRTYYGDPSANADYYAAREKSLALLKEWLSPQQLKEFEQTSSFEVTGSATGNPYRIHQGTAFNVTDLGECKRICFVPKGAESIGDIMLAQKIMLENDEPHALKIANREVRATLPA